MHFKHMFFSTFFEFFFFGKFSTILSVGGGGQTQWGIFHIFFFFLTGSLNVYTTYLLKLIVTCSSIVQSFPILPANLTYTNQQISQLVSPLDIYFAML